jgi:hypothetical protein
MTTSVLDFMPSFFENAYAVVLGCIHIDGNAI